VTVAATADRASERGAPRRASCVVVAFHRAEALARLVGALTDPQIEIVVVNVEDDPAVARVAKNCTVVPVTRNVGYGAAVNIGVRHVRSPFVVFMNDDVVVSSTSVLRLVDAVADAADVAVPRVEDDDGDVIRTIAAVPTPASLAREWLLLPDAPVRVLRQLRVEKWREPQAPEPVSAASAMMVATSRSLLLDEPLPEDYFLYWEESEWFWRLQHRHTRVEYRPDAVCRHDGGRDDVRPEKSRLLARNAVRCVRRTQGRGPALVAYAIVVAWNLRLALVDTVRELLRPNDRVASARARARRAGFGAAVVAAREIR